MSLTRRVLVSHDTPQNLCSVLSVWPYTPIVRALLHMIKIHGNFIATQELWSLLKSNQIFMNYVQKFSSISSAPPSLWSRLRGKFDIPGIISSNIRGEFQILDHKLPGSLYWKINKNSFQKNRSPIFEEALFCKKLVDVYSKDRLCVDDVFTTGSTAVRVIKSLATHNYHWLALADASRKQ